MSFLPIVERELRVAARKPATYRNRMRFVVVTSLLAALLLVVGERVARQMGNSVFPALVTVALFYCLIAGVRHAADALSEEKREGTLGLLFLTDLRGYDVVLGKLVAISTRTLQGLVAFLPVLSTGLLLGGITPGEFWRAAGVLANTLFFSLCLGLWVSARSRRAHVALAVTAIILILLAVVPLSGDWVLSRFFPACAGVLVWMSPLGAGSFAPDLVYRANPQRFWGALLLNHLFGWCFLFLASAALPHSWQDRPVRTVSERKGQLSSGQRPARLHHTALRRRLLDLNPICWLASRDDAGRSLLWLFVAVVAFGGILGLLLHRFLGVYTFGVPALLHLVLALVLKLWVAWRSCATLAEARRTGAVELLLATPLKVDEIIVGHWQALQRFFLWPVVAVSLLYLLPVIDAFIEQPPTANNLFLFPIPAVTVFGIATFIVDLLALAWVGMWMGLSQSGPVPAFAKTVLYVMIVPAVVFCLPNVIFDLFWITWARRKLEHEFRRAAVERYTSWPTLSQAPPLGPLALPPVISRPG